MALHPRNRHQAAYDFPKLVKASPELERFVIRVPGRRETMDFADPASVKALNGALLKSDYSIVFWDIPENYLCPPIPGRADMIHHLADLLAADHGGGSGDGDGRQAGDAIPRGGKVRVLDIGVGANCVFPIIGRAEYGWSFVGSEVDPGALACARLIVQSNPALRGAVELRFQAMASRIFEGILKEGERFDLTLCNPPFHSSPREASEGSHRKWRNLGRTEKSAGAPIRNFGGQGSELWCPGGELAFIQRMVEESARIPRQSRWFTSMVSREAHLPAIQNALTAACVTDRRVLEMGQGQKRSRVVAWSF